MLTLLGAGGLSLATSTAAGATGETGYGDGGYGEGEYGGGTAGDDVNVSVSTEEVTTVDATSATLTGAITELGDHESVDAYFEYGPNGDLTATTARVTRSSTGSFSETVTGLESDTTYEFRAVATASDGDTDAGSVRTFTTDASNTGPSIDRFEVKKWTTGPWSRAKVQWTVADPDGDLAGARTELIVGGTVADTATTVIDGDGAAGEHKVRSKGVPESVRLVVTDDAGNETTAERDY